MPSAGRGGRYHHGDLRAALVDTAVELIGERGVRGFSLAEASRRLGVAASAPYAHFSDREDLLAAVAVHAWELFYAALRPGIESAGSPVERLAAMARSYVRFAAGHRALFDVLYEAAVDKTRHPEIEAAEKPLSETFAACVSAISGDPAAREDLAETVEATAHGLVTFLLAGDYDDAAVEVAAERAARATRALVEGRHLLTGPA